MNYIHFFSEISSYVESFILTGGYIFIFLFTALEGIPLLGMLVPGHIAIILAGFFSKIGLLDLYWAGGLALLGALLGDYFGYYIGKKYGMPFIDRFRPYFFIKDSYIEKARTLLNSHTGKALIAGRFSPMTRAIMPFLVGCSGARAGTFWLFNIIGAISWISASFLIGYIFGSSYHIATLFFGKFVLFALITAGLVIWGYYFINARFHIFRKFELFMLGINFISLYVLAKTIQDALSAYSFMTAFDVWVNLFVERIATPFIISISQIFSNVGSVTVLSILGVLISLYLLAKREYRNGFIMLASIGGTGLLGGLMKELFMRARPDNQFISMLVDPSFPSGHSAMIATFGLAILYIVLPKIYSRLKREVLIVLVILAIISVGLSRIFLNVHWFSDVLSGWALGLFVASASVLLVRYVGVLLKR